jgi:putative hydrolase of the HAD superfamily
LARWRRIVGDVLDDVDDATACFEELFTYFRRPASWRIDPDVPRILPVLRKQGYTLGVASNYDHRLRSVVAGLSQLDHFSCFAISAEVGWRKPAPQFFAALCELAGMDATNILLVGDDRVNDYDGARAAGMHAVLVDPGCCLATGGRIQRLGDLLI